MPRATKKDLRHKRNLEITGVVLIVVGLLFGLSIFSSAAGAAGALFRAFSFGMFGLAAYVFPFFLLGGAIYLIATAGKQKKSRLKPVLFWVCMLCALSILHLLTAAPLLDETNYLTFIARSYLQYGAQGLTGGGAVGSLLAFLLKFLFGKIGALIVLFSVIAICLIVVTQFSPQKALVQGAEMVREKREVMREKREQKRRQPLFVETLDGDFSHTETVARSDREIVFGGFFDDGETQPSDWARVEPAGEPQQIAKEERPLKGEPQTASAKEGPLEAEQIVMQPLPAYQPPIMDMLSFSSGKGRQRREAFKENAVMLEDVLASFGISAKINNVVQGPAITRYELTPAPGVKVSRIVNLADDIALKLAATSVRIEAPIPGKAAIGIEVPNKNVSSVNLRDVLDTPDFKNAQGRCCFAVGKDITGENIIADLSKMPHLLVAGTTGSGKSVCINSMIISLVYKYSPEDVRFIMVDPKVVELNVYNGLPHLLLPVVTEPKKAAGVLKWAVNEMTDRYNVFAKLGVRDLSGYNKIAEETDEPTSPQIVVIVDELADLMMTAPHDVEDAICRLAQMGRAAGIHLVLATQRPDANVITGLIKANIPSRIAFSVPNLINSRIILDMGGAEKLLGKGDMLYFPGGAPKPVRVQGCFISDAEVRKVVGSLKKEAEPEYQMEILDEFEDKGEAAQDSGQEQDELLPDAVEIVMDSGQASISMIQRRLRVGYARAARLIDEMEVMGIVSGFEGSKARRVLIDREDYERIFSAQGR